MGSSTGIRHLLAICMDSVEQSSSALHKLQKAVLSLIEQIRDPNYTNDLHLFHRNVTTCWVAVQSAFTQLQMFSEEFDSSPQQAVDIGCDKCHHLQLQLDIMNEKYYQSRQDLILEMQKSKSNDRLPRSNSAPLTSKEEIKENYADDPIMNDLMEDVNDALMGSASLRKVKVGEFGSTIKKVLEYDRKEPSQRVSSSKPHGTRVKTKRPQTQEDEDPLPNQKSLSKIRNSPSPAPNPLPSLNKPSSAPNDNTWGPLLMDSNLPSAACNRPDSGGGSGVIGHRKSLPPLSEIPKVIESISDILTNPPS